MTLDDLKARLAEFEPGDWFQLEGSATGWGGMKIRPWILIDPAPNHPFSFLRPRTASGRDGLFHQRHPDRHAPRCQIDKPGKIPSVTLPVPKATLRTESFRCSEPYKDILQKLLPSHLR